MHGSANHITRESLPAFFAVTLCGIEGVSLTCPESEVRTKPSMTEAFQVIADQLCETLEIF